MGRNTPELPSHSGMRAFTCSPRNSPGRRAALCHVGPHEAQHAQGGGLHGAILPVVQVPQSSALRGSFSLKCQPGQTLGRSPEPPAGGTAVCPPLLSSLELSVYPFRTKQASTDRGVNPSWTDYGLYVPRKEPNLSKPLYSCAE